MWRPCALGAVGWALGAAVGCDRGWQTVDRACPAVSDFGYADPSLASVEAFTRAACYRSLLGLNYAGLDVQVEAAAQAHAEYMSYAGALSHSETDASNPYYSGESAAERVAAAGYVDARLVAEVLVTTPSTSTAVDVWMNSVYHRIPFTMPEWLAVGVGQADEYVAMTVVARVPPESDLAVIYPVDGQSGVPTTFYSDNEEPDPAPDADAVGSPVTVTVNARETHANSGNVYDLQLRSASFTGPDGDVPFLSLEPATDPTMFNTVALLPEAPLERRTEYTATFDISWTGGQETLSSTFKTE